MGTWNVVRLSELRGTFRLDPEFWQPEHLEIEAVLLRQQHARLGDLVTSLRKGVFNILADSYVDEGVPFYRSSNVGQILPKEGGLVFITPKRHTEEGKTALQRGDIMLAKTGKEAACVVTRDECNVSQDVIAIRPNRQRINPFYLAVFLNTRFGMYQMRRWFQGQVQYHLSLPDSRQILVPLLPAKMQSVIEGIVHDAERALSSAFGRLTQAEDLLITAIGLSHLDLSENLFYEGRFSDLQAGNRFGAEYFMPCKKRVLEALTSKPGRLLGEHCRSVRDLFNAKNASHSDQVRNYDLTDALEPVLDNRIEPMSAVEVGSTKKKLQAGDVVISRLRSYLREIALVRTTPDVPAVGSSEFIVLRQREKEKSGLTPESLLVYLRSLPVQTILKWSQDGSQHPRFTEEDLLAIPVPQAVERVAPRLDQLVNEALAARAEAARLLERAKSEVERLVLGEAK